MSENHTKHPFYIFALGVVMGVVGTFAVISFFVSQNYTRNSQIRPELEKQGFQVVHAEEVKSKEEAVSKLSIELQELKRDLTAFKARANNAEKRLTTKEIDGLSCISCPTGGTVSGIGGDNKNYSESFPGNTKICVSGYYVGGSTVFARFTKDGYPLKPNWGVKAETFKVNCKK